VIVVSTFVGSIVDPAVCFAVLRERLATLVGPAAGKHGAPFTG